MAQEVLSPIEDMPIGLLAQRVQTNPSLAMELPGRAEVAAPERWSRRLMFVLEAAMCGELDERQVVEDMPALPETPQQISLWGLGRSLDRLWRPTVAKKLSDVYKEGAWQPLFKRTQSLLDESPKEERKLAYDYYNSALTESSPTLVVRYVRGLYVAALVKQPDGEGSKANSILAVRQGMSVMRRLGVRGFDVFALMMKDLEKGDRNKVLELQPSKDQLRFAHPMNACPVGTDGLVVSEVEEAARQKGQWPFGCPAIKGSRIVEKLAHRVIDDGERLELFPEPEDDSLLIGRFEGFQNARG